MIGKIFLDIHGSRNQNNKEELSMNKVEIIKSEVEKFPEPLLDEVLDFVHFLKGKIISGKIATAFASESSLKKDWLRPEEDEAWQNL
jgi:hypothetical protein